MYFKDGLSFIDLLVGQVDTFIYYLISCVLLFARRRLIEAYHTDPHLGVACLTMVNKLIPLVDLSPHIIDSEKDALGSKIYTILNGLA